MKLKLIILIIALFLVSGCGYRKMEPQNPHRIYQNSIYSAQYSQQPIYPQTAPMPNGYNKSMPIKRGYPLSSGYYPSASRANIPSASYRTRVSTMPINPYNQRGVVVSRYNGAIITQHNIPHMARSYVAAPDVSSRGFNRPMRQTISPQARKFLAAINAVRARGAMCAPPAPPVNYDNRLEAAARAHAQDMAYHKFLNHTGSDGSNFLQRIERYGYPASPGHILGEVLTFTKMSLTNTNDMQTSFERMLENFLQSPNHCRIIMNPRMKDVGVGYTQISTGYYWVMEFGSGSY